MGGDGAATGNPEIHGVSRCRQVKQHKQVRQVTLVRQVRHVRQVGGDGAATGNPGLQGVGRCKQVKQLMQARWATHRRNRFFKKNTFPFFLFFRLWSVCGASVRGANIRILYAEELEPLGPGGLERFGSLEPRPNRTMVLLDLSVVLVICLLFWSCL